jgi:hypothetical protein
MVLTILETPNPIKKLKSCPENMKETAVEAYPRLAKIMQEI